MKPMIIVLVTICLQIVYARPLEENEEGKKIQVKISFPLSITETKDVHSTTVIGLASGDNEEMKKSSEKPSNEEKESTPSTTDVAREITSTTDHEREMPITIDDKRKISSAVEAERETPTTTDVQHKMPSGLNPLEDRITAERAVIVDKRSDSNEEALDVAASSVLFRPLFRYRAQVAERSRVNRPSSARSR